MKEIGFKRESQKVKIITTENDNGYDILELADFDMSIFPKILKIRDKINKLLKKYSKDPAKGIMKINKEVYDLLGLTYNKSPDFFDGRYSANDLTSLLEHTKELISNPQ